MDGCDCVNARLQCGYDALVDFPSLGMSSNSMPNGVSGMAPFNPIFGYDWDPLNQMEYLQSSSLMSYSQYGNGNPQHQQHLFLANEGNCSLAQDQSVSAFFEDPQIFSAMICPFGVSKVQTYCSNWEDDSYGETLIHAAVSQECKIFAEEILKSSPKQRRRKRGADENKWQGDPYKNDNDVPNQKDEKKQKVEGDPGVKSSSKKEGDRKTSGASKPNYVHVRTRQGQAMNSHSLAERVRREKISERMRVLQMVNSRICRRQWEAKAFG